MAALTIRKLESRTKERLRIQAARHGRSMEEEARAILNAAVLEPAQPTRLGTSIRSRFARLGGVKLDVPLREPIRNPPKLK
jgi:antitoxin FitA